MNNRYKYLASFLLLLLQGGLAGAITITSSVTGYWEDAGTWSLGRKPTCGDTIVIPSGKTVTVNSQDNLVPCGAAVIAYVAGMFQFTNGNKIDFPCGSWVYIQPGGIVKKVTSGGGNSTLISICGYIEWKAGDGPLTGTDTLGGHGSLPVTWLQILASLKGKKVELSWSTAVEINNEYFDVMRSADGITYHSIGKVNGNGNSTIINYYSILDDEPFQGVNYYKLLQVDYDGTRNPSDIVAIYNSSGRFEIDEVRLSPNPVTSAAMISFQSAQENIVTIEIKNASGQICLTQSVAALKGINTHSINRIEKLAKGIYTLTIATDKGLSRPLGLIRK